MMLSHSLPLPSKRKFSNMNSPVTSDEVVLSVECRYKSITSGATPNLKSILNYFQRLQYSHHGKQLFLCTRTTIKQKHSVGIHMGIFPRVLLQTKKKPNIQLARTSNPSGSNFLVTRSFSISLQLTPGSILASSTAMIFATLFQPGKKAR